ncbi:MAG: dihydroorotate dehydrogenase [Candidatus Bathyarchaeota archaeon]
MITIDLCGLKLANPTILASGILGYTGLSLRRVIEAGAGAVITKSMGLKPRMGYPNPTIVQTECGLLNAMGLPNSGINHFKEEMDQVSCPHIEKAGAEIGCDPILLAKIVKDVKKIVKKPIIVKLTPNVTNISDLAKTVEKAGADAITAVNTFKAMAIDTETNRPILANKYGGLSGPAIKPMAIRCVYDIFRSVDIPIIGCGGISSWQDAVEFMLAGASAVQIGTAIAFKGDNVFRSVTEGIETYLKRKGLKNVNEIVGLSHKY